MSFNKGDFTQQGIAGHVNANLRLNEKRLVNIDMTSNEEAEGCTIAGTVTDLLNDKVYNIGSGVSGNIEITENGENINVAPYATATVNVAGLTLNNIALHVVNNTSYTFHLEGVVTTQHFSHGDYVSTSVLISPNLDYDITACTHFGGGVAYVSCYIDGTGLNSVTFSDEVNCTGSYDSDYQELEIPKTDKSLPASITIVLR